MNDEPASHEPGRRRFQFGLRMLFAVNFLAAVVLGVGRFAAKPESILTSTVLLLGASWTLLMAAMGDAMGREWGALVQTVLGALMWCMLTAFVHNMTPIAELWSINVTAMAFTIGAMGAITFVRLRSPLDSDDAPHLTRRLLESQKRRRGGTSSQDESSCLPD
jgi:hypothetical protein